MRCPNCGWVDRDTRRFDSLMKIMQDEKILAELIKLYVEKKCSNEALDIFQEAGLAGKSIFGKDAGISLKVDENVKSDELNSYGIRFVEITAHNVGHLDELKKMRCEYEEQ